RERKCPIWATDSLDIMILQVAQKFKIKLPQMHGAPENSGTHLRKRNQCAYPESTGKAACQWTALFTV
ncbi:MAG: hypothetical protein OXC66_14890, partial [Roseovarius sp.]|nr:hypothetical protein [Roseovarius sp.]